MLLLAVGRIREPEATLFERYRVRITPALTLREIPDGRGRPAEMKRREAEALIAALPASAWAVALDQGGVSHDSIGLAGELERWLGMGRQLVFVLGGAEGLDASVLARADARLSLGPMTWPHLLARVMLAEQIWRARAIAVGHPYHRADRPEETRA